MLEAVVALAGIILAGVVYLVVVVRQLVDRQARIVEAFNSKLKMRVQVKGAKKR